MNSKQTNLNNELVHLGRDNHSVGRAVNLPLHQSSTMLFNTLEEFEEAKSARYEKGTLYYGRYGNPAIFELESMMAQLEQGTGCIALSSGLTACVTSLMTFCSAGSHVLVADTVYGPTRMFCDNVLKEYGVDVTYFDPMIGNKISELIQPDTAVIFLEAPGSGTFEIPDIPAIASAAKVAGVVSIIDGTWATPLCCQPLTLGIDVVVHSGSKYISGHSDAMIGFIVTASDEHYDKVRKMSLAFGDRAGSQDVFLALRGLRTLAVRLREHQASTYKVIEWLQAQPQVSRILHPAFSDCPGHEFWQRDFNGSTGLFSVEFVSLSEDRLRKMINSLELFSIGLSWGGFESLVIPVEPAPFRVATQWENRGPLIRLSIGLEDPETLISDLQTGFRYLT
ncbi:cystathionine beta-lyase [Vibrio sp. WJH972]